MKTGRRLSAWIFTLALGFAAWTLGGAVSRDRANPEEASGARPEAAGPAAAQSPAASPAIPAAVAPDAARPDFPAAKAGEQVLAEWPAAAPATGGRERVRLIETDLKYPRVFERETVRADPLTGAEVGASRVRLAADHFMVRLNAGATEADLAALNAKHGTRLLKKMHTPGLYLVQVQAGDLAALEAAIAAYKAEAAVVANSEPDYVVDAVETIPDDPMFAQLYGLHNTGQTGGTPGADIRAAEVWDVARGNRAILVGVIDTGIDDAHPDLAANMWRNPGETGTDGLGRNKNANGIDDDANGYVDDWRGWDFVNEDNNPMDDNRHGTHCAGTIGGVGNNGVGVAGVNWEVSLVGLKFLNGSGSGYTSDAVDATHYATAIGCQLTSNSWGGGGDSPELRTAIGAADLAGRLFVAAAGNNGSNSDSYPMYPGAYTNANILSIAATDHNDALAGFSNYGATTVDLGAPGVGILSTTPGNTYSTLSGTSMATPHVAGAVALIWGQNPGRMHADVKAAILAGADPVAALAGKTVTGGRLNALRSLASLGLQVAESDPPGGSIATSPPEDFAIRFTDAYAPTSVQAADLTVNGRAADEVLRTASNRAAFHFMGSPVAAEGVQTMAMASNAVTRLSDGSGLSAWTATFRYDLLRLAVTATAPAAGTAVAIPFANLTVEWNEPIDPASAGANDLVVSQGHVTGCAVQGDRTLAFALAGIAEEGLFTYQIPAGALADVHGNPSLAYAGSNTLDIVRGEFSTNWSAVPPRGGLIYAGAVAAAITAADDTDGFYADLDAGQTLTAVAEPGPGLAPALALFGPDDVLLAAGGAVLQTAPLAAAGRYRVEVSGAGGSTGDYELRWILNAARELEESGGAANGTVATAENLADSFLPLIGRADRGAALGRCATGADEDWYRFELRAGTVATLAVLGIGVGAQTGVELRDGAGALLAAGTGDVLNVDRRIADFAVPSNGTYHARVTGTGDYSLVIVRGGSFGLEPNGDPEAPQRLAESGILLGFLGAGSEDGLDLYYSFDENHGAWVSDDSGNGRTGTVAGAVYATNGVAGGAYSFNGNGRILVSHPEFIHGRMALSYGAWFNPSGAHIGGILGKTEDYNLTIQLNIGASPPNLHNSLETTAEGHYVQVENQLRYGEWQHVMVTHDGTWMRMYCDGVLTTSIAYSVAAPIRSNSLGMAIGDSSDQRGWLFRGLIDEVRVYDRALSAREVLGLYELQSSGRDCFTYEAGEGEELDIQTHTPADGSFAPDNALDPQMALFDPAGNEVAADDNGAPDGRNARIRYTAPAAGLYSIQVRSTNSAGDYVLGINVQPLALEVPARVAEGDGALPAAGRVSIGVPPAEDFEVDLVSSDPSEAQVPDSVWIAAGQTSAVFAITVLDDVVLDGSQSVGISASAAGYAAATRSLAVDDNETGILEVMLPESVLESDGVVSGAGLIEVAGTVGKDVRIALASSDPSEATVPAFVTIPAGHSDVWFSLTAVDDQLIDGDRPVEITAAVTNWTGGVAGLIVEDDEDTALRLAVPAAISEGAGAAAGTGTVSIAGAWPVDLAVALESSDSSEATVPASVVIPAGQLSASFAIAAVDDVAEDGAQPVAISAAAAGFEAAGASLAVADDDVHRFAWGPIGSPQLRGYPIAVRIAARTIDDGPATAFAGAVALSAAGAGGAVPVSPSVSGAFAAGEWIGAATVSGAATGAVLTADDGAGHAGDSVPFDVVVPASGFTNLPAAVAGAYAGSLAWGDYDGDGKLDLLASGMTTGGPATRIYRNGQAADSTNGLRMYYSFDVNGGAWVPDDSGNGHTGAVSGATFTTNGARGGAYSFDGNDRIVVARPEFIHGLTSVSYGAWFNPATAHIGGILGKTGDNDVTIQLNIGATPPNLHNSLQTTAEGHYVQVENQLRYGEWQHVMVTHDGTWMRMYCDGVLTTSIAYSVAAPIRSNSLGMAVGDRSSSSYWRFRGLIDEVRVYDRALSAAEVASLYSFSAPEPGFFGDIRAGLPGVSGGAAVWGDADNDNDPDILVTGLGATGALTRVYLNHNGAFADSGAVFPGLSNSAAAWGDFDNDGRADLVLAGETATSRATRIWRNLGAHAFADAGADLPGLSHGAVAWVDYDNDGDLDLFLAGQGAGGPLAQLRRNDRGVFADSGAVFAGAAQSSAAWGDFDGDGDADLLLAGSDGTAAATRVYRNDGAGAFAEVPAGLAGVSRGSAAWGDFDNDGRSDILIAGQGNDGAFMKVYRNEGAGVFSDSGTFAVGLDRAAVAAGDFDNDGDLDLAATGLAAAPAAALYRNDIAISNLPPAAPTGLSAAVDSNRVTLSWAAASDAETPSAALTYNVRVGAVAGGAEVASPLAGADGFRKLAAPGNAGHRAEWTLTNVAPGTLRFSVQAIDAAHAGSPFAPEQTFGVLDRLNLVLPGTATEGDGISTNAAQVRLRAARSQATTVTLWSADTGELQVQTAVVLAAGRTSETFLINVVDDDEKDGAQSVAVTAQAAGFQTVEERLPIYDNELDALAWEPVPSPQRRGVAFPVRIAARATDGEPIRNFAGSVNLSGFGAGGAVPIAPAVGGPFAGGAWTGAVRVLENRVYVVLTAEGAGGAVGDTIPFDVVGPVLEATPAALTNTYVVADASGIRWLSIRNNGNEELAFQLLLPPGTEWVSMGAAGGTLYPSQATNIPVTFSGAGRVPGGYLQAAIELTANDGVSPSNAIPVSMIVQPAAPVFAGGRPFAFGTSNLLRWTSVAGASRYWAEISRNTNGAAEGTSGWIVTDRHVFAPLAEGQLYHYRAIASATGALGSVAGPWSEWASVRQLSAAGDWDGDAIPDGWEGDHDLDPLDGADAGADPDGDGVPNRDEYVAGTGPGDEGSNLMIMEHRREGDTLHLRWRGGTEVRQILEGAESLDSGEWRPLLTNEPPTDVTNGFDWIQGDPAGYIRIRAVR